MRKLKRCQVNIVEIDTKLIQIKMILSYLEKKNEESVKTEISDFDTVWVDKKMVISLILLFYIKFYESTFKEKVKAPCF